MTDTEIKSNSINANMLNTPELEEVVSDYVNCKPKIIFTMGKGGVGKTTVASYIALQLAEEGIRVHLTTTDP